jgi:hypothetical protein
MTDNSEDWEPRELPAWEPKTPREERGALAKASATRTTIAFVDSSLRWLEINT